MGQQRGLWAAIAIALVLAGAVFWSLEDEKKNADKPPERADAPRIFDIPEDQFKKIELARPAENSTVVLERDGAGWKITAPEAFRAEADTVNAAVKALSSLTSAKLVDEKATDFNAYGFNAPRLVLTITKKDGQTHKLEVADENPTTSDYYARVAGSPKLYTLANFSFTSFDKRLNDLRDKRLITVDDAKLTRFEYASAKGDAVEFGKNATNEWQIVKPKPMRADSFAVEEMVRKIKEAKMDLAAPPLDAKLFDGATAVATVKLTDAAGTQTLEVRRAKDDAYVKSSVAPGIHKAAKDVADSLDKTLDQLRQKKILDFGFSDVTRLEYRDGTVSGTFERKGSDWQRAGKKVENVPVLIDKLRDLTTLRFLESGMNPPLVEATVVSNEGKRTEKIQISKSGNMYVAQRVGEPSLYEIDGKLIEDMQKAAAAIK